MRRHRPLYLFLVFLLLLTSHFHVTPAGAFVRDELLEETLGKLLARPEPVLRLPGEDVAERLETLRGRTRTRLIAAPGSRGRERYRSAPLGASAGRRVGGSAGDASSIAIDHTNAPDGRGE